VDLPEPWESAAITFDDRARVITKRDSAGHPAIAAFGAMAAAEHARQQSSDAEVTWSTVADAWRVAGQPYREAYARLREAEAAAKAGRHQHAARALAAGQALARELRSAPLLGLAGELEQRGGLAPG
jgi:hypothetical protein